MRRIFPHRLFSEALVSQFQHVLAASSITSAARSAAPGRANWRTRVRISSNSAGFGSKTLDLAEQALAIHFAVQNHSGSAAPDKRFGIAPLMIVGGKRKRNQHRRHSCRCDLAHRPRSRPRDDQIRLRERFRHILDERYDLAVHTCTREFVGKRLVFGCPGLMNNADGRPILAK